MDHSTNFLQFIKKLQFICYDNSTTISITLYKYCNILTSDKSELSLLNNQFTLNFYGYLHHSVVEI